MDLLMEKSKEFVGVFEEQYGTEIFLKVAFSSISRLLVHKGIVTEDELCKSFLDEISSYINREGEK